MDKYRYHPKYKILFIDKLIVSKFIKKNKAIVSHVVFFLFPRPIFSNLALFKTCERINSNVFFFPPSIRNMNQNELSNYLLLKAFFLLFGVYGFSVFFLSI